MGGEKAREIERYWAKWVWDHECPLYSTSVILDRSRGVKDLSSLKSSIEVDIEQLSKAKEAQ